MKLVFSGTPELALPPLEALLRAGHELLLVITQPDRPKGRSGAPRPSPVKQAALAHGLPVHQPESINDPATVDKLVALAPDVLVVAAFGQILGRHVIEAPRLACVNVHASLLPKYRGAAPIPAAILNGDAETGVTIQKVARKLDAGDIIRQASIAIDPDDTAGSLAEKLARLGAHLLVEALADLETGTARFTPQDHSQATYAPMMTKDDGLIDWSQPAAGIERFVRAMAPWPQAFTFLPRGGTSLRLNIARVSAAGGVPAGEPGEVVEIARDGFMVKAGLGSVVVRELQPAGKRQMTAAEFVRGYRLARGERLAEA